MIDEELIVTALGGPLPLFKFVGGEVLVVSWDGERATVGAVRPRTVEGGAPQDVLDVRLDDNSVITVSPDQVFLLQKERKQAKDLKPGDSLLAFYTRWADGYLHYLDPGQWYKGALVSSDKHRWRPLSRLVAEHMLGRRLGQGESVRFRNGDRSDVRPENLNIVSMPVKQQKRRDPFGRVLADAQKLIVAHRPPRNHQVVSIEQGHCFAAGSKIFVANGSMIVPTKIEVYAAEGIWKPILGYDEKKQLVRKVNVTNAWLTKKAAPVMKIGFSNGSFLRVTPEHQVLTVDRSYVEAWKLKANDRVISAIAGFNMKDQSVLTNHSPGTLWVTSPPKPDQSTPYRVYDVTTETGNLIVDGVVCHNSTACLSISGVTSDTFVAGGVFLAVGTDGTAR
jgi:intein/homing endonuclease